jgi:hypothetical protein
MEHEETDGSSDRQWHSCTGEQRSCDRAMESTSILASGILSWSLLSTTIINPLRRWSQYEISSVGCRKWTYAVF